MYILILHRDENVINILNAILEKNHVIYANNMSLTWVEPLQKNSQRETKITWGNPSRRKNKEAKCIRDFPGQI